MTPFGHVHAHHVDPDALSPFFVVAMLSTEEWDEGIPRGERIQRWV